MYVKPPEELPIAMNWFQSALGYGHSVQAPFNVPSNFKRNVILGSSAVCPQGPGSKELHVRCFTTTKQLMSI